MRCLWRDVLFKKILLFYAWKGKSPEILMSQFIMIHQIKLTKRPEQLSYCSLLIYISLAANHTRCRRSKTSQFIGKQKPNGWKLHKPTNDDDNDAETASVLTAMLSYDICQRDYSNTGKVVHMNFIKRLKNEWIKFYFSRIISNQWRKIILLIDFGYYHSC